MARMEPRTEDAAAYRRSLVRAAPLAVAIPVGFALIAIGLGIHVELALVAVGAAGWLAALVLRAPVALVATRVTGNGEGAQPWIVAASGPLEEVVRLGILLAVGPTLERAVAVGIGWAAIEVVYAIVSGMAMLALIGRTDPEAEQVRALIPFREAMTPEGPWWGLVERVWASALHVAFTLLVAAATTLVLVTIVAHSATNLALLRAAGRLSLPRFQLLGALWASAWLALAAVVQLA
jgi:hypothetical protein